MSAAKFLLLLVKNKKVRNAIIGIVVGIVLIVFLFISQGDMLTFQNSTALATAAEDEYNLWQRSSPKAEGYSCQGEKYCKHFGFGVTDWCCFFAGYCIEQAGLDKTDCGYSSNVHTWIANLRSLHKLEDAGTYTPKVGNLIFFDYSGRQHYKNGGMPTHIGIVTNVNGNEVTVVAGNEYNGQTSSWSSVSYVRRYTLNIDNNTIACYGAVGADDTVTFNIRFTGSQELSNITRNVIAHNEIGVFYDDITTEQYGSVIADDNGALSIGAFGWHANRARELMQTAYSINSSEITTVCKSYGAVGTQILADIKTSASYVGYIPSTSTCMCIKAILLSEAGQQAQDKTSAKDAESYIEICKNHGLTKNKPIVYCSDILNQWGTASFNARVYRNGRPGVLYGINNKMTLKQIYTSKAGWGSSEKYKNRRQWTYNYLKQIK